MNSRKTDPLYRIKLRHFGISAFFLVAAIAFVVIFMLFFRIHNIEVENCVYSSKESVLDSTQLKNGTHIYAIDKSDIAAKIMKSNPYISEVHITRKGAQTLCISVTEDAPRFYIIHNDKYVVLSGKLRVLAEFEFFGEMSSLSVSPISLPTIEEATIGKTVVFEKESAENGKECIELLSFVEDSDLAGYITNADLSQRFDLRFTYKDKYEIRFGSPSKFESKLSLVVDTIKALEDPLNGYSTAKGIIHASVTNNSGVAETSFEPTGSIS